tara:strand:+ start:4841 stop:7783 length:2943 start_codon:yes stop_codon:yes gene_type:complete
MAIGRISGPLLKANLLREGVDLAFENDLLYLDVNNSRIGINTDAPQYDLDVNGTINTPGIEVTNFANIGDINITGRTISTTQPTLNLGTADNVVYQNKLIIDSIDLENNSISTNTTNENLEFAPNGTGTVEVFADTNVYGNVTATGNITADGNITLGDADTDNVTFNAEIASDIIPDITNTYSLGNSTKKWADVWTENFYAGTITADGIIADGIDLALRQGNILYVAENGNDSYTGDHPNDPYGSLKYALSQATSGDTIHIYPGTYTEIFPMTVPTGVSIKGHGLRSVKITPTTDTRYNDAFLLNGETTIEDLTVANFFSNGNFFTPTSSNTGTTTMNVGTAPFAHTYVSGGIINILGTDETITAATYDHTTGELVLTHTGIFAAPIGGPTFISGLIFSCNSDTRVFPDNGYAFRFATDFEVTTRSPYVRNVTVLTAGSTTSVSDPRGFNASNAGKGAYVDGAYATENSKEAAMLFHAVTFITPGVDALTATNGARIEWLNSFTYFANKGLSVYDSNDGLSGNGKTRIKLSGITGTFAAGNTVTFTSTDASTVANIAVDSVDGDILIVDGKTTALIGFDLTPQSISNGAGATATSIVNLDLQDFGAEIRMIGSANVYGNYGLYGDGPGVIVYAIGHNLAYIGNGKESSNQAGTVIQANEVVELNDAKIRYNSVDHKGDFRVGDLFHVNQEDGTVTFSSSSVNIATTDGLVINTGGSTTTITGNKLETGNLRLSGNTIESLSGNIILDSFSGTVKVDSTSGLQLPSGTTAERPTGVEGIIRYNTDTNLYEGYDGNWISLNGVSDLDLDTYITAELTPGANDDTIRFYINSNVVTTIDNTKLSTPRVEVDDIVIDGNTISTSTADTDLILSGNGTGEVVFDNISIKNSTITNRDSGGVFTFDQTGNGYYKIDGTGGFVVPVGTNIERPIPGYRETGMIRWNTEQGYLEIFDGFSWVSVAGSSGSITFTQAEDLVLEYILVLG